MQSAIAHLREDHPGSLDDEVEETAPTTTTTSARPRRSTLNREIDYTLGENSGQVLSEIEAALKRIEDGTYGDVHGVRQARSRPSASRRIRGRPSASTTRERPSAGERAGPPCRRSRRLIDRRALAGLVRAALAGGRRCAVDRARGDRVRGDRGRPADEVHRHEPARARRRRARRRPVLDSSRAELGHRLRPLRERDRRW